MGWKAKYLFPLVIAVVMVSIAGLVVMMKGEPEETLPSTRYEISEEGLSKPANASPVRGPSPSRVPAPVAVAEGAATSFDEDPGRVPATSDSGLRANEEVVVSAVDLPIVNFRDLTELPEGFKGERLYFVEEGVALSPGLLGDEDKGRVGTLESPIQRMKLPSVPILAKWNETLPVGTRLKVEFAFSRDTVHWSAWEPVEAARDTSVQFEPDDLSELPIEYQGIMSGSVAPRDLETWSFFRYRVTFEANTEASPIMSSMFVFYEK